MSGAPDNSRRVWQFALGLGALFALLYFLTRSPSLDEWDSVQFAMGVSDFNLARHQPHPPGYPVYIGLGWAATHALGLNVPTALELVSALGGGLAIGCWFLILARRFGERTAWLSALALGSLLIMWMCSTKVLTDPLGAGLLALTLALWEGPVGLAGFAGAMAVGARPQNFLVVLLILCLVAYQRGGGRAWVACLGAFFGGCLCWLVPVAWLQARTPEAHGNPWHYGAQLFHQWQWRMNQPKVFIGASGGHTSGMLNERLGRHFVDWVARGFGLPFKTFWGWLGTLMLALGWTFHALTLRRRDHDGGNARAFWLRHAPWALLYIGVVFTCLPGDQRYYLPIYPLLIVAAVAGWQTLPCAWGWSAALVPACALAVTVPFIGVNHREVAPPVKLMEYLNAGHPKAERESVWLVLHDNRRHANWYAPDFHLVLAEDLVDNQLPAGWADARAIYTDQRELVAHPPPGKHWRRISSYSRSPLIYRKHNKVNLWQMTD